MSSAYGNSERLPKSEHHPTLPLSPYAVAKLAGEQYCAAFSEVYGLETVRLRYFNVFGPRQSPDSAYAAVIPLFIQAMTSGKRPVIHGDGLQSRDFTYVADVVQANLLAAATPGVSGRVYNVACGRKTTLLELVDSLNSLLGTRIAPIHAAGRPGDVKHSLADIQLRDDRPRLSSNDRRADRIVPVLAGGDNASLAEAGASRRRERLGKTVGEPSGVLPRQERTSRSATGRP